MSSPILPDTQSDAPIEAIPGAAADPESNAEPDATGGESQQTMEPVVARVVVPDRADAPISEITERFFKSLLTKVRLDRIEELHLFSPLRQGGVETGIAVIAAREEIVPVPEPIELPLSLTDAQPVVDAREMNAFNDGPVKAESVDVEAVQQEHVEAEPVGAVHVDPVAQADGAESSTPVIRHTVYTARYRLVQKGPERGKWESEVVAEAEAPLITVERVVRGVQRRAGEESDTTRFTQAQIARALRLEPGVVR